MVHVSSSKLDAECVPIEHVNFPEENIALARAQAHARLCLDEYHVIRRTVAN